jgi:hypothetical protein
MNFSKTLQLFTHINQAIHILFSLDHIVNSPNTLANKIYIKTEKNNKWVTTIKEWINKLGIGHLTFNTNNSKFYINSIQQRIQDQTKQKATLVVLHCTPKISFINFRCRYSKGSASLNLLSTPQTSLPYRMMGTTRESEEAEAEEKIRLKQYVSLRSKGRHN